MAEGQVSGNPVPLTAIKSAKHKRVQVMTDDAQKVLEQYLFQNMNDYNSGILIALYTGMRLGEVCALKWKDYDEKKGILQVVRTVRRCSVDNPAPGENRTRLVFNDTKTESSERTLVIPSVVAGIIKYQKAEYTSRFGAPKPEDYIIFSKFGAVMDPDNLSHRFSKILDYIGLDHVKFHALRHPYVKYTTKTYQKSRISRH